MKKIKLDQISAIKEKRFAQRGVMVLEAMIAILIFSLGILALMALQAAAIRLSGDAKGRTDAAFLANNLISQLWAEDPVNLPNWANNATVNADPCSPSGGAASAAISAWLTNNVLPALPNATLDRQRVSVLPGNVVEVSLCWRMPGEPLNNWHNYTARTAIVKNPPPAP